MSPVEVPIAAARAHMIARALLMFPVSVSDASGMPSARSVVYSRAIDISSRVCAGAFCGLRSYLIFYHMLYLSIDMAITEKLVRVGESAIFLILVMGTAFTAPKRLSDTARFIRCIHALIKSGVVMKHEDMERSFRLIFAIFTITTIMLIVDVPLHMIKFSYGFLCSFVTMQVMFLVKTTISLLFVFHVRWLNSSMTAVIEACKRESTIDALTAVRRAAVRHRLLRAAHARLCRSSEFPIAFALLLLYVQNIIFFYHFIADMNIKRVSWQVMNALWLPHNYVMLYVMVEPCQLFRRQDRELVDLVSGILQSMKRGSLPAQDEVELEIMFDRVAIARSTKVQFKMLHTIEVSRDLFLSITSTMLTYIVILVHINFK